jgi:hypothetical protein
MSIKIRKITLVIFQIGLAILVISLAFNFAFQAKTTSLATSNGNDPGLSLEDNIYNLDVNGGSEDLTEPKGIGNDFDIIEYFTTSDDDIRLYNETGTPPEIEIDAPSQSSKLTSYNLTITDCRTEGGLVLTDDTLDEYNQSVIFITSDIQGIVYQFNVSSSIFGHVFIDSFSFPLATSPNGSNFTAYILGEKWNGSHFIPDVAQQYFVQNFTAPANFSWAEYIPYEESGDKLVLPEGSFYIGITLADSDQDTILLLASNDTHNINSDDDGRTYFTTNRTVQPEPTWELQGKDLPFMYHYSDVAATQVWGMKVNDTIIYAKYWHTQHKGNATWSAASPAEYIQPRSDGTFAFDITNEAIPDFIHLYIDYTLTCEFSDGTSQSIDSKYSVTSGNNVTWALEYPINVPSGLDSNLKVLDIPSDWSLTSVKAPDNSEKISTVTLENSNLTIPSISQSGIWRIYFTSPNYADSIFSQEKDSEGGYFNQTTFYSSDEMRVKAYLENLTGPVGGGTATLTVVKPDRTGVAHTTSGGANSNGKITFSDWEVPYNQPTGNYHLQVLWNNGTEVGFLDTIVKINSESLDGDESSQESGEAKNYLTVNADYDGIIERGHSVDIQLNVTRWGNVVEGLDITLKFLDETYIITVNDDVESSELHVMQMSTVSTNQEDSYFDITENDGIYDIQIETANLSAGSYTFEVYASKEGFEDAGSIFEFTIERMSVSTFFVVYSPKVVSFNPLPSLSLFILSIGIIWLINLLLYSPIDSDKFIDLYVYTNTGLGIDHVSFGSFETDEALMTGALAGISSLIAEATQTKTPPKVIEKEEFTIIIEYGEFIAASLFAKVKAKSFAHRKISQDLKRLVKDFEGENKAALEHWTGDLSKIEPLSKYIISEFRLKPSMYLADLKYEYGVLNYEKKNLFNAFLLLVDAFKTYLENKNIEKSSQAFFLLEEILRKLVNYAPFRIVRPFVDFMVTRVTNRSLKFALMRLISKYIELFKHS